MKKGLILIISLFSVTSEAMMPDDPWVWFSQLDELEYRAHSDEPLWVWDAAVVLKKDLHQWGVQFSGEYAIEESATEASEWDVFYGHAISPFWNLTLGVVHDAYPKPEAGSDSNSNFNSGQTWASLGVEGTAPYFIQTEVDLLVNDQAVALRSEFEKEWMLTQRWVVRPELELAFLSDENPELNQAAGLLSAELGVRLGYEVTRQFAPYLGAVGEWKNGLNDNDETAWIVLGLHAWF